MTGPRLRSRGDLLLHPVVVAALVAWAVNDHVLKQAYPGLVTGKLSDVTGVIVAPLIVVGIYELRPGGRCAGVAVIVASVAATAVAFTLVELVPAAAGVYERVFGLLRWPFDAAVGLAAGDGLVEPARVELWSDAADLLTIPFLAVPLLLGLRAVRSSELDLPSDSRELELSVSGSDEDLEPAQEALLAE